MGQGSRSRSRACRQRLLFIDGLEFLCGGTHLDAAGLDDLHRKNFIGDPENLLRANRRRRLDRRMG